jgi:peptidyl-dipeptidase A
MRKKQILYLTFFMLLINSCSNKEKEMQQEVQAFLDDYNKKYQKLYYETSKTEWTLNTKIIEGDSTANIASREASEELAKFTGSKENSDKAGKYLKSSNLLTDLQVRQLKKILYNAAANPEAAGETVKEKIKIEKELVEKLYGFNFKIDGKQVSTNDIDDILKTSTDLNKRLKAWSESKEVGKGLKTGVAEERDLRNKSVQALGYNDFFSYMVSDYGMSTQELKEVTKKMISEVWPLYRELHTWARYELANKYKQPVPDMIPAHWLPNRWGQNWKAMIKAEGLNIDSALAQKNAEWIVKEGELFYISLGFDELPASFYEKSSLYPLPPDTGFKKNNHASAWHMNLEHDIRSLMSVEPNTDWWQTTLHELGHVYYFVSYTNPDVPIVLRDGANRAFHEAIGDLIGLAALQKPFLRSFGLLPENTGSEGGTNDTLALLSEALDYIVFIPWGAGVMTEFEYELYSNNLPIDQYNRKWWELVKKYQGIVPPSTRGEEYCDAASKTHIIDDPAGYYDYAMSNILLFQFHDHIAKEILNQDPHATNYYGNKKIGKFLKKLMYPGASVDWREHLKNTIGSEMSAGAMIDYFEPLMQYLKRVNQGRKYTLPESI